MGEGPTVEARVERVDDVAPGAARVIKIDTQGSEWLALQGMRGVLEASPQVALLLEFWPYALRGTSPEELLVWLARQGFTIGKATAAPYPMSPARILRQALADFGVPCTSRDRVELLSALNAFLRDCAADGTTAALVIDEAHNLKSDVFENLRLLSNYETYTEKLLQIVLVGQPELETKLRQANLRQVTERVAVRCNINPLTRAESLRYVEHRLQRVGGSAASIFTSPALELILWKARGIPRRINILCHTAMLFAFGRGERLVNLSLARIAVREKEGRGLVTVGRGLRARVGTGDGAPVLGRVRFRPWWAVAGFAAGVVVMMGVGHLDPRSSPTDATAVTTDAGLARDVADHGSHAVGRDPVEDRLNAAIATLAEAIELRKATGGSVEPAPQPAVAGVAEAASTGPPPAAAPAYREVQVPRGTTLRALVKDVYGYDRPELVERVMSINPQIVNADRIIAGDTLRFPDPGSTRRE
jgi:nucleoid-associated protein YgaU